jgi:tetratricopeptide (TPR) repeat protein
MATVSTIYARALEKLESGDLDGVRATVDEAVAAGVDEHDPRLRHLQFMLGWLDQDASDEQLEQVLADGSSLLDDALALPDGNNAARIVLDVADTLASAGEFDDVEHALRALAERDDVDPEALGDACLIRAQILLDQHEDADEALAVLDSAPELLREDPGYLSLRAAALLDLTRDDEAVELLQDALAQNDDVELRYQLGLALRELGREDEALEHLLEVRRRDLANFEVDVRKRVPHDEVEDLRRRVEDVLDTLPDPVISKVAQAPIRVERWATEAAIRAGAAPRAPLAFEGQLDSDEEEGRVTAMVVYRDAIVAQIEDDDEILDVIAYGLVEEFHRYFNVELIPGE